MVTINFNYKTNKSKLEKPEIIIKESVLNKLVAIIIFFALIFIMIVKSDRNFFDSEVYVLNLLLFIIFGLFILLFLLSCIKIFDENPTLKINERGVWHRSSYIPFSPLKLFFCPRNTRKPRKF